MSSSGTVQAAPRQKKGIPGWSKGLIILFVIILVIVILIVIIVLVGSRAATTVSENVRNGVGESCTEVLNCAPGLDCRGGECTIPLCPQIEITQSELEIDGLFYNLALSWTPISAADFYIIFLGTASGFDPKEESEVIFFSDNPVYVISNVPPSSTVYLRVLAVGEACASSADNISDEVAVTTPPIL